MAERKGREWGELAKQSAGFHGALQAENYRWGIGAGSSREGLEGRMYSVHRQASDY